MYLFSFSGALIHLLKSSLGTGILAIPRAFKSAGLMVGLFGTIIIGILCTHTIHILVSTIYKYGNYPNVLLIYSHRQPMTQH